MDAQSNTFPTDDRRLLHLERTGPAFGLRRNIYRLECRTCGEIPVTHRTRTEHEVERTKHDEGCSDMDYTVMTVQCDECLAAFGDDDTTARPALAQSRAEAVSPTQTRIAR